MRYTDWIIYTALLVLTIVGVTVAAIHDPFLAGYIAGCCVVLGMVQGALIGARRSR